MTAFSRVLVATDFTDTSDRALDWAIELAARVGGRVTLMHAYEIPILGFPDGALIATAELASRIADGARAALEGSVDQHRGRGVPIDPMLCEGVAWEEINRVADELDADVVVIGTHGRKGLARALLGSVAERVIRTARHPVVAIPGPRE
ncbi:MAG TPA: universal stress protein [Polyangiaceae bacterium]|nr:universal stress protein [Polyangiaceae bacterium]